MNGHFNESFGESRSVLSCLDFIAQHAGTVSMWGRQLIDFSLVTFLVDELNR
jgi:hypothetical protein